MNRVAFGVLLERLGHGRHGLGVLALLVQHSGQSEAERAAVGGESGARLGERAKFFKRDIVFLLSMVAPEGGAKPDWRCGTGVSGGLVRGIPVVKPAGDSRRSRPC